MTDNMKSNKKESISDSTDLRIDSSDSRSADSDALNSENIDKVDIKNSFKSKNEGKTTKLFDVVAIVSKSVDEPEKFLGQIEEYYPGYMKKMLDAIDSENGQLRKHRILYGALKAYMSLAISAIGGFASITMVIWLIVTDTTNFHHILLLVVFFAITQSGMSGINKVVATIANYLLDKRMIRI